MTHNHKKCEDEDDAARMAETIIRLLGYPDVQRGPNTLDVRDILTADALGSIARSAERIARWARNEVKP